MNEKLTPHPQADILRAIADGKPIEGRYLDSPWIVLPEPFNAKGWEFRIKPETIAHTEALLSFTRSEK